MSRIDGFSRVPELFRNTMIVTQAGTSNRGNPIQFSMFQWELKEISEGLENHNENFRNLGYSQKECGVYRDHGIVFACLKKVIEVTSRSGFLPLRAELQ